jgi:hypothetical protein
MPDKISEEQAATLKQKRSRDWESLVKRSPPAKLAKGTVFVAGAAGAVAEQPPQPLAPCSQRQLQWIAHRPATIGAPTTAAQIVGNFSPIGTAEDFLPSVLQVQYLARIYLTPGKDPGAYIPNVIYAGGLGDVGTTVHR